MDKYLTKPINFGMECKEPSSILKSHAYCIDSDGLEDFKSEENLEYIDCKDIRSFFHTKPLSTKNCSSSRSKKSDLSHINNGILIDGSQDFEARKAPVEKTANANMFKIFKKSAPNMDNCRSGDSDVIDERTNKKRHLPESSDEEEGNVSMSKVVKVKFNWSKKPKLNEETKPFDKDLKTHKSNISTTCRSETSDNDDASDPSPTNDVEIKKAYKPINKQLIISCTNQVKDLISLEEEPKLDPSNEVLDDDEPTSRLNSSEDDFVKVRPSRKEKPHQKAMKPKVDCSDVNDETDGMNENVTLRRSSRKCSKPARFETMVVLQDEVTKDKRDVLSKTLRKSSKTTNNKHPTCDDDDDDVMIIGVANNDNLAMHAGKVVELAPMFRKPQKISPEELERKKNFLMSGVPDEIKRQQAVIQIQAASISLYSPFPRFKHVTQLSPQDEIQSPQTSSSFLPPFLHKNNIELFHSNTFPPNHFKHLWINEDKIVCHPSLENSIKIPSFVDLQSEIIRQLLLEIKTSNLQFPVEAVYMKLKEKQRKKSKLVSKKGPVKIKLSDNESEDSDVSDDDDDDDEDEEDVLECEEEKNLLWTEKYAPTRTDEIIGNKTACKRTFDWLSELKAKYSHSLEDKGSDSMDDFWTPNGMTDSCSNPSSSNLNALIIQGPHGVGKTSLVYAVAEELGFKVFEVNPSSARDGRQVWSQLQEATQSHQLHTSTARCSTNQEAQREVQKTNIPKSKSPKNKSILSLLKPKAPPTNSKIKSKQKIVMETIKKKKQATKKGRFNKKRINGNSRSNGYNSDAKTSLILFDEADVVFENDRGFWSAVQKFVKTTKRPIVLTVSDECFVQKFNMNIEVVHMLRPENNLLTSYLQTICLAEGVRTDRKPIESLVESFNHDLRKSIHQLQGLFSGRISSCHSALRPIRYSKSSLLEPPANESKEVPMEPSQTINQHLKGRSIIKNCNGENMEMKNVKLCQTALTSFLCSLKVPTWDDDDDDDDDDFVLSPALKRSTRRCNVMESDDDDFVTTAITNNHINKDGDIKKNKNDDKKDEDADQKKDDKEEEVMMMMPKEEEEFVTCHCDVPVFIANTIFNQRSSGMKIIPDVRQNSSDDLQSLKQLSRSFNIMSFCNSTFTRPSVRNESSFDLTSDLSFRKISRPLPGDLDQFGLEEGNDFVDRTSEEIVDAMKELSSRLGGEDFEGILKTDSMEDKQKLNRVFENRQCLISDLSKNNLKIKLRGNVLPELLPMLIKLSEVESEKRNNQSRRRFLRYLSNIYPSVHPDRFNFKM